MSFLKWRVFQGSFFKQIGFLFSSQKNVQKCFLASEVGVLSLSDLPLSTGYVEKKEQRMAWSNIQNLKIMMQGQAHPVLPINERSLYPLDPHGKLTEDEKRNQASLKAIGSSKYVEAQSNVSEGKNETQAAKMAKTVLWSLAIVAALVMIALLMKGC
jgi:hypothetical protein